MENPNLKWMTITRGIHILGNPPYTRWRSLDQRWQGVVTCSEGIWTSFLLGAHGVPNMFRKKTSQMGQVRSHVALWKMVPGHCRPWRSTNHYFKWWYRNWLVVWNINFIFPYIGNNHPNWLICFRGVETTNQERFWVIQWFCMVLPQFVIILDDAWWWDNMRPCCRAQGRFRRRLYFGVSSFQRFGQLMLHSGSFGYWTNHETWGFLIQRQRTWA